MEWHLSNPRKTQEILDFLMLSRSSQGLSCTHGIPFLLLEVRMHRAAAGSLFPPPGVEGGLSKPLVSLCLKPPSLNRASDAKLSGRLIFFSARKPLGHPPRCCGTRWGREAPSHQDCQFLCIRTLFPPCLHASPTRIITQHRHGNVCWWIYSTGLFFFFLSSLCLELCKVNTMAAPHFVRGMPEWNFTV